MNRFYQGGDVDRLRIRRIRLGLGLLAGLLAMCGFGGKHALDAARQRTDRLVAKTVTPLEQTALYGLELGRLGGPACRARLDSLEAAYIPTYLDSQDIHFHRALRSARRVLQSHPGDSVAAGQAFEAFSNVARKNGTEARILARNNSQVDKQAGWAILLVGWTGALACLALLATSVRQERSQSDREHLIMSLIESAPDAIVIFDPEPGTIVVSNAAAVDLFRLPSDAAGNLVFPLHSPRGPTGPQSSSEERKIAIQRALDGEKVLLLWTFCDAHGGVITCEARLSSVEFSGRKLVRASFLDVTAREASLLALSRSELRFRSLVEESSMAIRISLNQIPTYVNKACVSLFGYDNPEDLLAIPVQETYHPDMRPALAERIHQSVVSGIPDREYDTLCLRKDGTTFNAHVWITYGQSDAGIGAVAFLVDTTESVKAAEREKTHREQLIHADRMASLGVLLAGMAHEINNPNNLALFNADLLGRILLDAETILDAHHEQNPGLLLSGIPYEEMKPEIRALVEGIRGGALRIRDIIAGLKDFSRRNPLSEHRPMDIASVVQSSLLLVGNLVRKSTDRFETELAPGLPKVRGDAQQLEQVVVNLLTNACQALEAKDRLLAIRTRLEDSCFVEVEVEDEGVGIPPENLPKIIDPFFTTKREEGGTGLGLSVSWAIVEAHGGTLSFLPRDGGGTRAVIRLPIAKSEEPA